MDSLSSIKEVSKETKTEPFVPTRRAPYLFQEELIREQELETSRAEPQKKIKPKNKIIGKIIKEDDFPQSQSIPITEKLSANSHLDEKNKIVPNILDIEEDDFTNNIPNYHEEVSKLYGIQKKIIHFFVNRCIITNDTFTGPITAETLCAVTSSTKQTLKKILERLEEKNLVRRLSGKRGKGGFTNFKLSQDFINVVRLQIGLEQNHAVPVNFQAKQELFNDILPVEWKNINFEPLASIGFGLPQIKQIYNKKINSPEVVQESINHFAYTLQHKPEKLKKYDSNIAVFMATMNKGGAWTESEYMSPCEIAVQEICKQKKDRLERISKMENEILDVEYHTWERNIDSELRKNILENGTTAETRGMMKDNEAARKGVLKKHFKENIWPKQMPAELVKLKEEMNFG